MDLSIIIPCYNVEKYLQKCLTSVSEIQGLSYELILINDGSTDDTDKLLKKFVKDYTGKAILIEKENGGLSIARNVGIDNAVGQYVMFLDSDDYICGEKLADIVNGMKTENLDIAFFDYQKEIDGILTKDKSSEKRFHKTKSVRNSLRGSEYAELVFDKTTNFINSEACFALYSREFLNAHNLRFEKGIYHEDTLFFYQMITKADRVKYYNYDIYVYVIRQGSITTDPSKEIKREQDKLYIAATILDLKCREHLNCYFVDSIIVNLVFYTIYRKGIKNTYDLSNLCFCKRLSMKSWIMIVIMKICNLIDRRKSI